jgi:hypothetical protein
VAIVGLVALFAVSAIAASAETTHEFYVNGKALTGTETALASLKTTGTSEMFGTAAGINIVIVCTTGTGEITFEKEGHNKGKMEYTSCIVKEESTGKEMSKCKVVTPIVARVKGHLEEPVSTMFDNLEGESSATIAALTIEGGECTVRVTNAAITGKQRCEVPEATTEKETHAIVCKTSGSSLEFDGSPAKVSSPINATLTGKTFSAK